jgi:predicted Zn-dependent peptidase
MKRGLKLPGRFAIQPSGSIVLRGIESRHVADRVPLYMVTGGNEPVFRLELMFRAGKFYETERHAASATAAILTEGTDTMSARDLAESLEYYGATVRSYSTPDTISVSVHAMTKFGPQVLEVLREVLLNPAFTEDELQQYQKKKVQRSRMSEMQNEYLANKAFSEYIFGADHPYGYTSTPESVMALTLESLRTHHQLLGTQSLNVFLAGDVQDDLIQRVEGMLSDIPEGKPPASTKHTLLQDPGKWELTGPQQHQVSVRIGKQIISRGHDDYPGLFLLNTILGGYHGSRLVRNLREAKGLTYGIQSNLESLLQSTCFVVTTDANSTARKVVLREIYKEIKKLRTHEVYAPELEMVRNYVAGNFLMQIDGPLNVVDTIKPLILHGLPIGYFEEFLANLKEVTPQDIQRLADEYLDPTTMTEVVVG